ncbi:hypothetical protein [Streptomyces sp. I05A-00742]|uniref:hypothetical protein n=1 Tax=Streptomyces sp. I05A-00742 TaxID=2732853 RepID=UPI001487A9F7|nr:hypothetical protein [Streptomyces sp. I05A-00742]
MTHEAPQVRVHPRVLRYTPTGEITTTLRVTIGTHGPDAVVNGVHLTLPPGPSTTPADATAPGWTVRGTAPGTWHAQPAEPPPAGAPFDLDLTGLRTSPRTGPVDLAVGVALDDGEHLTTHRLFQQDELFAITRLAPTKSHVEYHGSADLTWKGPDGKPFYTLWRSDEEPSTGHPITVDDQGGACRYTVHDLTRDITAFLLVVNGRDHQEDRAVTYVIATKGDVLAGALSVDGTARLLHAPQEVPDIPGTYRADTDGFLSATVTTGSSSSTATLTLTIAPQGADAQPTIRRSVTATLAGRPVTAQLPLPAGSLLTLRCDGAQPIATATWFPLGGGNLGKAGS